ncbi:hypothetical protein [Streptomyces sp. NPDC055607]
MTSAFPKGRFSTDSSRTSSISHTGFRPVELLRQFLQTYELPQLLEDARPVAQRLFELR